MGNLRSMSLSEKNQKRAKILNAALQSLEYLSFHDITMSYLANRVDVAKGTLYLYFPTKEGLFLSLLTQEMQGWFKSIHDQIPQFRESGATHTVPQKAEVMSQLFTTSVKKHIRMIELLSFLKPMLEEKVTSEELFEFKSIVRGEMAILSKSLVEANIFPQEKAAMRFLVQTYSALIGIYQVSSISKYESDKELQKAHHSEFYLMLTTLLQTLYLGSQYSSLKSFQSESREINP
jgi:AcrR family transcriptional regulator